METDLTQSPLRPVTISCGYSSKSSANYNSSSYNINLQMEILINGKTSELELRADQLYDLCRKIVKKQQQSNGAIPDTLPATNEQSPPANQPAPVKTPPMNTNYHSRTSISEVASEKQLKYILALARSKGVNSKSVKDDVFAQFHKPLEKITRAEASEIINHYKMAA